MAGDIQQFNFSVDLLRAILWQYNEAKNLQALLEAKAAWYDANHKQFWENWTRDVFDLRTANEFGIMVWSIILGQPLYVVRAPDGRPTFGFESYHTNFERGNFSSQDGTEYKLSLETARVLLRLRYYQLTGSGTVPEINRIMKDVFANYGEVYLFDQQDMTQTYIFKFSPPSDLIYLMNNFDILPRPTGVLSDYSVILNPAWGFGEYHDPFNLSNFSEL